MFVSFLPSRSSLIMICFVDSVVVVAHMTLTTLGRLTFQHDNGLSYNALGSFRLPVQNMLLSSSVVLCTSLVGVPPTKSNSVI
jgi:hypothetical protein